ncbi:hypothetical protein CCR75_006893 [Bremia lactucae]|uniref:Ribosome assembly protein 3 n=1 Tax=Bremia lactucae TaxID=4779 RepID=A0A976FFB0_BRELC|nr:hypothetical protein CCR75_006893 [Bremia lactucae]
MNGDAAQCIASCDRLIALLSENGFQASAEKCAEAIVEADAGEQRLKLLEAVTNKSLRCAELIAKSLETSATLSQLQNSLKNTYDQVLNGGSKEDEEMEDVPEDLPEDETTTLLLQDLVAAGDEVEDATKTYARLGIVRKVADASRTLMASADHNLQKHLTSNTTINGEEAVQNEFRQLYMEEFTTAFGDELDQFRQEERFESKDVSFLISCIHAGGDIFSPLQKKLFVESVGESQVAE